MKKHFATYNQSLALKESGFDEPCIMYIDDETRKFKTYEEAESACIDKLIEIIKKK
jgi:hypothetical protein